MVMKNIFLKSIIFTVLMISFSTVYCQSEPRQFDPIWVKYYRENPPKIKNNFMATDFIKVIELVKFKPVNTNFKGNVQTLKMALLRLDYNDLEMLKGQGWYHSQTFKHDDYFYLYNQFYNKISKPTWDEYCPYLLPIMDIDGTTDL